MSHQTKTDTENFSDIEELFQIETRCRELKKEKNMLKDSQSESFELIRRLEQHVKSLSEARSEDKKHIQKLEKELLNCSQEIDYLQDQLNVRNTEVNWLIEHVHSLELKLADIEDLHDKVDRSREELKRSDSERLLLLQELDRKEAELQNSIHACIEKLEESIAAMALESQCEIESMKLDIMALEQSCFEANKIQEESTEERARMNGMIQELEAQFQDAQKIIESLGEENKELKEKLDMSEKNARLFCQGIEEWLQNKDRSHQKSQTCLSKPEDKLSILKEFGTCGEVLGPLLSPLAKECRVDADSRTKMENMSRQIQEYECLVKQLKEELREEKLKAKEEAKDLAQEMAELRYQITGLLEEECKRRAYIEQAALQRVFELEAQVQEEKRKSFAAVGHLHEA
ncbi:LOW QUALITY PROTEIN: centrosomal protein of 63 kDa-like [Juglans microcarpa x Juglans regia]|uniref:LOW QUALITY PROTEIN: centrosomal protein of 63 kDa-like n=1 Tax=Juglans microcarpa x Juglans regia TaxID=2249226 RepID=UPI001B7E5696|nr:LOW QUALITY PROTEIN: centrosomal protein of 63 kDa-like [Juglans microcarpa x Juglans regia]